MSSESGNPRDSPPAGGGRRRSSFVDLFGPKSPPNNQSNPPRRLSITTLGLSTMPGATTSPYNNMRARAESVSSANSASVDESPFEDDPPPSAMSSSMSSSSVPATPFNRRMSFGAKAIRDPRSGSGSSPNGPGAPAGNGTARPSVSVATTTATHKASASPVNKSREGFDFAESMRARAERGSISGSFSMPPSQVHQRSKSNAAMEPPREMPKAPKAPDAFQERILKGDFYMD